MNYKKLGDYVTEFSQKYDPELNYPVYSVTNNNGFCTEYFNKDVSGEDKSKYKVVPRGYFAYNPSRINVGSVDWQKEEEYVIVSPLYVIFKCSDKLNQDYLKYFLRSNDGKAMIASKVSGSVRNNLNFKALSSMEFNIGTIEEQNTIVSHLKEIESAITNEKKQIELYDELIKARFVEMFGDPVFNNMNWDTQSVEAVCSDIYGGGTPSKAHPEYYENGDIPWVSSKDMKTDIITESQIYINHLGVENSTAKMVPVNSVIMVIRSGILKHTLPVAINAVPLTVNQDLKVFLPNKCITAIFLSTLFKMLEKDILTGVRAVTADNIEFNSLKQRQIIVPPLDLQKQFTAFIEQLNKSKFEAQKRIEVYEELLNKKMSEYFMD